MDYHGSYELMDTEMFDEGPAAKDASSCCQACQDFDDCVAMTYSEPRCIVYHAKDRCPAVAFAVMKGEPGFGRYSTAAPGCGEIREEFPYVRE